MRAHSVLNDPTNSLKKLDYLDYFVYGVHDKIKHLFYPRIQKKKIDIFIIKSVFFYNYLVLKGDLKTNWDSDFSKKNLMLF